MSVMAVYRERIMQRAVVSSEETGSSAGGASL